MYYMYRFEEAMHTAVFYAAYSAIDQPCTLQFELYACAVINEYAHATALRSAQALTLSMQPCLLRVPLLTLALCCAILCAVIVIECANY
jgi:hypothetical protein